MDTLQMVCSQKVGCCPVNWTAVSAIATCLYLVFTAGLFIYAYRAFHLSRSAFNLSESAFRLNQTAVELTQRPFIAIESIKAKLSDKKTDQPSKLFITLKNVGNVPSKNVSLVCVGKMGESMQPIPLVENIKSSIFAGLTESIVIPIEDLKLIKFALHFERVIDSAFEIRFKIEYQGVADTKYTTDYKYRYKHKLSDLVQVECNWT